MLKQSGQINLIFCTTNLFDKGCVAEIFKVFALESHDNLIKQVVLRANKTWLSRELCLSWLIVQQYYTWVFCLLCIYQHRAIISCCRVFQNDKHSVICNYRNYPMDSEIIESDI